MKFYTSAIPLGNNILYRWIEDGKRYSGRIAYCPTYYTPSNTPTDFKTLKGESVAPIKPGTMNQCRDWLEKFKDVAGFTIYGDIGVQYQFLAEAHPELIDFDTNHIRVAVLDIETASEKGFALPSDPTEEVTAITVKIDGKFFTVACGDYKSPSPDIVYVRCKNEAEMLKRFLDFWSIDYPDVITGWNVDGYDVPYLVNRITRVLGKDEANRLSPWKFVKEKFVNTGYGNQQQMFQLYGIAVLDYIQLFKKFAPKGQSQESYKLDDIAWEVVKDRKIPYEGALHHLYKNDFQKFIEYNIHDVRLVEKIDAKLQLLMLAYTMAYKSKTNFEDVFFQTRMWDSIIFNFLRGVNVVIPPRRRGGGGAIKGAWVKQPAPGMYEWLVSFDFSSLYPSLMMFLGISPETYLGQYFQSFDVEALARGEYDLKEFAGSDVSIAANGAMFKKTGGFLPIVIKGMMDDRKKYKKLMLTAKGELQKTTDATLRRELESTVAKYDGFQGSAKVSNNSLYGVFANPTFRYYHPNQAEAITVTGQAAIQWVVNRINTYLNKLLETKDFDYVIACDTDSSYLNLKPLVSRFFTEEQQKTDPRKIVKFINEICETTFQPFIERCCSEFTEYLNGNPGILDMKRESIANKGFWTTKKRYAMNVFDKEGVTYAEPDIAITGIEIVRSSTPKVVRSKLKDALKIIMNGTNEELLDYIADFKAEFMKMPVQDVSFPRGIYDLAKYTDPVTIYKPKTPIHVKGSLVYNELIRKRDLQVSYPFIGTTEKIKFVYLKEPNPIGVPVIAFPEKLPPEFDLEDYIDRKTQFEKTFLDPLKSILSAIGWQSEKTNYLF